MDEAPQLSRPALTQQVRSALIPLYRDDSAEPSEPSSALVSLADLYLYAAEHRTRHVALVWPSSLKTVTLVHALATLVRWRQGDKQGIRGLLYPVKANAFHRLNHIAFDRAAVVRIAQELVATDENPRVIRPMRDKDPFFFSLTDSSLSQDTDSSLHPMVGELLPHFLASPDFQAWPTCDARLLALIRAKLRRRAHAMALRSNFAVIGNPRTAPDALFALDGRMSELELRKACESLKELGAPEVVLVQATRAVRFEAKGWKGRLARFCLMLEDIYGDEAPGVIAVTDDPHAAYKLKDELWSQNHKRATDIKWRAPDEYAISGFPSIVDGEGLLSPGEREAPFPAPREFDVYIVDADMAKVSSRLARIANGTPGGREAAKPLVDAAAFLARIAALPCGVRHVTEYLESGVTSRTRAAFDWPAHSGAVLEFDRQVGVGEGREALMECLERGSRLYENYYEGTPFAHKLAELVAAVADRKRRSVAIIFTKALYKRLGERFLREYSQYPSGQSFGSFEERVSLMTTASLLENLDALQGSTLVFAGLNEESLRVLLTDDSVPAHSAVLLTQRAAQFLRVTLRCVVERLPEFKAYKPRMESILRQLTDLPDDASVLSTGDYVLPTFRVELSADVEVSGQSVDPDSWVVRLENGATQYRRDTSEVYVYDPASQRSSDFGFRRCQVRSLEVGDKLFVMSAELREMVEQILRDGGIEISSDRTFESALRSYHLQVQRQLEKRFPQGTLAGKVQAIRDCMLELNPKLEPSLPTVQAMRLWIDLGRSSDTPFAQLRPQAPMKEAVFNAFAEVLGFSTLETAYQWQRVIMAVRNSRRLDGRHVSDIYAYMLLQPESAMTNAKVQRRDLQRLFDKARENVLTVEAVAPLKDLQS